jgi:repressor LexA
MKAVIRLKEYIDYKGLNNSSFEKENGLSNGYIATQLKRNADLGEGVLTKILDNCLELSPEWLLTGKGEMLKVADASFAGNVKEKGYPLIDATAIGGTGNCVFTFSDRDVKDYYAVPKFNHKKVDFMIEVEGSSMYPKYKSGDIVACTVIKESSFIQWNKTHVVATQEQGIIIKRIKKGASEDCLTMISDNENYDAFEVPKNEITGIALVVGVIRLE